MAEPTSKAISQLSNSATLTGAEELALVQTGQTVKAPLIDDTETVPDLFRYFGGSRFSQSTILTADVLTLNATPVTLISAPGAGKGIVITKATASLTFNSVAYATQGVLNLRSSGATDAQFSLANFFLFGSVSHEAFFIRQEITAVTDTQILANVAIVADVSTADPTAGDSDIVIRVWYDIITI